MRALSGLSLLVSVCAVHAHGGHDKPAEGETVQQYAQRHMASEHHIDSFDLRSFFGLHDLDRNNVWDRAEIEAIYGVHHVYSQKKSKDEIEHQKKADHIVDTVLSMLDKNKDGKVTPEEFEAVGLDGLPNFDSLGAEGHHYDVESEFFLHHEEEFHSTPETQTDDAYNHPEDLEHFAMHEEIERKEAEKEAKFQGISVEEALAQHEEHPAPVDNVALPGDDSQQTIAPPGEQHTSTPTASMPKITREVPLEKQDPHVKFQGIQNEPQSEWGLGEDGYKSPKSPVDRMKKNLPYKYKFRRNWGDF